MDEKEEIGTVMRDPSAGPWMDPTLGVSCSPECPSDLALDELHVGEQSATAATELHSHIKTCSGCQERWQLRVQGLAAFPQLTSANIVAQIHQRVASLPQETSPSVWQAVRSIFFQPAVLGTSMAIAAALMMILLPQESDFVSPADTPQVVRTKGASFSVFRNGTSSVEAVPNGGTVLVGESLRFKVQPQPGTDVMVVGLEKGGKLYLAYPLDGSEKSAPSMESDNGILPGAIALDDGVGREQLFLVSCNRTFGFAEILRAETSVSVPDHCSAVTFELNKRRP